MQSISRATIMAFTLTNLLGCGSIVYYITSVWITLVNLFNTLIMSELVGRLTDNLDSFLAVWCACRGKTLFRGKDIVVQSEIF